MGGFTWTVLSAVGDIYNILNVLAAIGVHGGFNMSTVFAIVGETGESNTLTVFAL